MNVTSVAPRRRGRVGVPDQGGDRARRGSRTEIPALGDGRAQAEEDRFVDERLEPVAGDDGDEQVDRVRAEIDRRADGRASGRSARSGQARLRGPLSSVRRRPRRPRAPPRWVVDERVDVDPVVDDRFAVAGFRGGGLGAGFAELAWWPSGLAGSVAGLRRVGFVAAAGFVAALREVVAFGARSPAWRWSCALRSPAWRRSCASRSPAWSPTQPPRPSEWPRGWSRPAAMRGRGWRRLRSHWQRLLRGRRLGGRRRRRRRRRRHGRPGRPLDRVTAWAALDAADPTSRAAAAAPPCDTAGRTGHAVGRAHRPHPPRRARRHRPRRPPSEPPRLSHPATPWAAAPVAPAAMSAMCPASFATSRRSRLRLLAIASRSACDPWRPAPPSSCRSRFASVLRAAARSLLEPWSSLAALLDSGRTTPRRINDEVGYRVDDDLLATAIAVRSRRRLCHRSGPPFTGARERTLVQLDGPARRHRPPPDRKSATFREDLEVARVTTSVVDQRAGAGDDDRVPRPSETLPGVALGGYGRAARGRRRYRSSRARTSPDRWRQVAVAQLPPGTGSRP